MKPDLYKYDAAEKQRDVLDYVLKEELATKKPKVAVESVEAARSGKSVYEAVSDRVETRILFISQDISLLNQTQQTLDGYLDLSEVFDEVHIVILREGIKAKDPVLRIAPNVWLYVATARHWWWTPMAGLKLIREQMVFADGFRPDLVVARDAYESALVAQIIAKEFKRPSQLHVMEDFTGRRFLQSTAHARWRRLFAKYLIPRFLSIRTSTNQIQTLIEHSYPDVPDIATLPRFNNWHIADNDAGLINIKNNYSRFSFLMMYCGSLSHESTAYQAIDAARFVLRNPRVGLLVIGDGSARGEFIKRTKILGIEKQVVFIANVEDLTSYFSSVDGVIVTDVDSVGDEIVIRAAATGATVVATKTPFRNDLFIDGESALLCDAGDSTELTKKINLIMNNFSLRKRIGKTAKEVVDSRLHEDPDVYRSAYRASVEQGLFAGEEEEASS